MCIRRPGPRAWTVPPGLTFRGWLRAADAAIAGPRIPVGARGGAAAHGGALPIGAAAAHGGAPPPGAAGLHRPTIDDLDYHLSTLFPPVRPRGHLELRMIDAQPGDGWVVPVVIAAAILDDPEAGQAAMAATQPLWSAGLDPWLRAARDGPADRDIAAASRACFDAAHSALRRLDTPASLLTAAAEFTERYVQRDRCPADDLLEEMA
jgi:glutamate--cysteine ligase